MKTIKRFDLKVVREKVEEYHTISNPADIAKIASSILNGRDQECFLVFPLDVKNRPLGYVEIARGAIDYCPVDMREVYRTAVLLAASAIIVVHNHPSGDVNFSAEDMYLTNRVKEVGELLGINLLDHIVVTDTSHKSMAEAGCM